MRCALFLSLALALPLAAQQPPPGGPGGGMMRPYDATQEATYAAVVQEVATHERGGHSMVMLTVKVGDKEYRVMAGSADFLKEKAFAFAKGDALTLKGVVADTPRGAMLRAREITKAKSTLTLIDKDGHPAWMPAGAPPAK